MNYVVDSYENYKEENRLTTNNARKIEFVTTTRVLDEIIHDKSKILDYAAGTGIQGRADFLGSALICIIQ